MVRRRNVCPSCGGTKTERARRCRRCFAPDERAKVRGATDPGPRNIDRDDVTRSTWRPPHLPPACATCRGFGYVQGTEAENGRIEYRRKITSRPGTDLLPGRRAIAAPSLPRERGSRAGGWHSCPDCIGHPGSVMSHAEWTRRRLVPCG